MLPRKAQRARSVFGGRADLGIWGGCPQYTPRTPGPRPVSKRSFIAHWTRPSPVHPGIHSAIHRATVRAAGGRGRHGWMEKPQVCGWCLLGRLTQESGLTGVCKAGWRWAGRGDVGGNGFMRRGKIRRLFFDAPFVACRPPRLETTLRLKAWLR